MKTLNYHQFKNLTPEQKEARNKEALARFYSTEPKAGSASNLRIWRKNNFNDQIVAEGIQIHYEVGETLTQAVEKVYGSNCYWTQAI
jgi:hypothetical protein